MESDPSIFKDKLEIVPNPLRVAKEVIKFVGVRLYPFDVNEEIDHRTES